MRLFHLTTWKPEQIPIGRTLPTSWTQSNYWTQQHDTLRLAQWIVEHEFTDAMFASLSSTHRYALALAKAQAQSAKENLAEQIRSASFPGRPSRSDCMFACATGEDLWRYVDRYRFPLSGRCGIELEVLSAPGTPVVHRADPAWLDCNGDSSGAQRAAIHKYWHGDAKNSDSITEVLFRGAFRVVRVLDYPAI